MSRILLAAASVLTLSLSACEDTSSTKTTRVEHADARLGSHVPRTNAAASQDEVNPALAGERAFAPTSTGAATAPGGSGR